MKKNLLLPHQLAEPPALQYNVFIHDVDKLISLNSQLLMTKGGWGEGGVSSSSLHISLNSLTPDDQGWMGWGWGVLLLIAHLTN